jgi:hypothetical protein
MIKKYFTLLFGLVFAAVTAQQAAALPFLTGNITFSGGATLDNDDISLATEVTSWVSPEVQSRSGSFTSVGVGDTVTIKAPWSFASGAVPAFWTVGGFTFDLLGSVIVFQIGDFLSVRGTGTITAVGFEPTDGVWNFSSQGPGADAEFSFSASNKTVKPVQPVPDDGAAVALLGIGFIGLEIIRRRFARA